MTSILLEVKCRRHPEYTAVQYPRRPFRSGGDQCPQCLLLWRLKHNLEPFLITVTAGVNK